MKRVYFDTAASPYLYEAAIYAKAVEFAGPDKILFGTDFPLLRPSRYFKEIETASVSQSDRAAICGENAAKLFRSRR
jgi:uncharacterized protein